MRDKSIQGKILEGLVETLLSEISFVSAQHKKDAVKNATPRAKRILKYLDEKNVRICKSPKVYDLVEHERLIEE